MATNLKDTWANVLKLFTALSTNFRNKLECLSMTAFPVQSNVGDKAGAYLSEAPVRYSSLG
jgi:hypothetical protein